MNFIGHVFKQENNTMARIMRKLPQKINIEDYIDRDGEIRLPKKDPYYREMVRDTIQAKRKIK